MTWFMAAGGSVYAESTSTGPLLKLLGEEPPSTVRTAPAEPSEQAKRLAERVPPSERHSSFEFSPTAQPVRRRVLKDLAEAAYRTYGAQVPLNGLQRFADVTPQTLSKAAQNDRAWLGPWVLTLEVFEAAPGFEPAKKFLAVVTTKRRVVMWRDGLLVTVRFDYAWGNFHNVKSGREPRAGLRTKGKHRFHKVAQRGAGRPAWADGYRRRQGIRRVATGSDPLRAKYRRITGIPDAAAAAKRKAHGPR
jgi:hypothetical protein